MDSYSWSFTTGGPDTTAPTVTAANPTPGATDVPVTTPVTVTFGEAVTDAQFTLKNPADTEVAGTTAMDDTQRVLTFTPAQPLADTTAYTGEVSGARDVAGNAMAGPYTWSFTTGTKPPTGLVAAYGMDEGAGTSVSDSSGHDNTGTATATSWQNGKYGKALSFNGTSSWVTVQDAASLRLTTGMTLSAWVNPTTVANWRSVVGKELQAGGASYLLYASDGTVPTSWAQTDPDGRTVANGGSPLPVNAWSHLAATYDGTRLRLFVNGQQADETELSGDLFDDGGPLRIGGNAIWGEYFGGLIDEVRIYQRAQTSAEIRTDMDTPVGSGTPNPDTTPPTVSAVTPAAQAGDVPVTTPVTATFSETVTDAQFTLKDSAGAAVAGTTAMDAGQRVLTFTPAQPLADTTAYTAEVSGAKDVAGNAMAGPYTWSFTTGTKPPTGLVAAYGMDEGAGTTVGDSSGHHNTGAARNTTWAAGKHGTALSFNGTSSWVTAQHAASLRLTDKLTLSAWVRPSALGDLWRTVLMKEHDEGGVYGLYASTEYTAPAGWLRTTAEGGGVTADDPLPLNQWSHLATTYDGATFSLYVNGTLVSEASLTGDVLDDGGELRIGGNAFWDEFYRGLIDEVRVYNRVQSAAEIQTDMNTPIGAVPVARGTASSRTTPAIAKLAISDDKGTTPTFTAWVTDPQGRPATVEVEVAPQPAKSSKPRLPQAGWTAAKELTWSGSVTGKAGSSRHTLRVPSGKLKKGQWMRWRARATVPGASDVWSEWQTFKVGDVRSGEQPPGSARASQATAATANFTYKHPSLEDCYATTRAPRFTDAYSRMQERPHSACWTSWIGHGGWEEYDDNGVKKRRNRTAWWVKLFPGPLRIPAQVLDKVTDDDVFTFRATWVAHTYIGDHTGNAIYKGGTDSAGLKPQNIKFWVKLTDFGVWNRGVKRTELDDDLNDVQIEFDLATQGCQIPRAENPDPTQLKTIAGWRSTPYLLYLIDTPKPAAHDREVCSIMPALTQYKGKKGRLPLWDQELLGEGGKRLGVVRWGQGIPSNSLYSPSYRCDWKQLGFGKNEEKNTGGCIYIRADRVFTMSKSRNSNFIGVINHIEKALSRSTNADTNPPFRPGDTTSNRDVKYPPHKNKTGTERPKAIPGNYQAAPNTSEGAALWRGADGAYDENRAVFSGHEFWVHRGWPEEFHMGNSYGSNYCKYYNEDLYEEHGKGALRCDEYPFASTQEGAAKDKINYSVQAVFTSYNARHGEALQAFYSQYRLLTYDPVNTVTKVSDSPFWVQIVE